MAIFECGHVTSIKQNGKNTVKNLRPICGLCNKSMGITNMHIFMKKYGIEINNKLMDIGSVEQTAEQTVDQINDQDNDQVVSQITESKKLSDMNMRELRFLCALLRTKFGITEKFTTKEKIINRLEAIPNIYDSIYPINTKNKHLVRCTGKFYCTNYKCCQKTYECCFECKKKRSTYSREIYHVYYDDIETDDIDYRSSFALFKDSVTECKICNELCELELYTNVFEKE